MNPAPNTVPDPSRTADPAGRRPRPYTPGLSDGLGDRLLLFDNSTSSSVELLRFKREFSEAPGFEAALRKRLEELSRLRHPSIGTARTVEWMNSGEGMALVSTHTAGRRLSEILTEARGQSFALELIRQIGPALALLQQQGPDIAHGALTADRIIVTREGRLVLVEHVLGSALELLHLNRSRMHADLGIAVPAGVESPALDRRSDVLQLGFVALSLLAGRRLDPADYPQRVPALLDELAPVEFGGAAASGRLRRWLDRALQMGPRPFGSAQEAYEAFIETPAPSSESTPPAILAFQPSQDAAPVRPAPADVPAFAPAPHLEDIRVNDQLTAAKPLSVAETAPFRAHPVVPSAPQPVAASPAPMPPPVASAPFASPNAVPFAAAAPVALPASEKLSPARPVKGRTGPAWLVPSLIGLATVEAIVIGGLIYTRPSNQVPSVIVQAPQQVDSASAPIAPPPMSPEVQAAAAPAAAQVPATAAIDSARPAAAAPLPAGARFGGVKINAPIELQVSEAGKVVGTTSAPIAIGEGTHTFDLTNDLIGYTSRQTVDVKPGQMASVSVSLPNGRISINAIPWADVTIDGVAAGQTPLANLAIAVGQHEIVFRHPKFGDKKETAVVKIQGLTRVSANLQQ